MLDCAPKLLGKDVVQGTPLAIHANLNLSALEQIKVLRAAEVAALIAVSFWAVSVSSIGIYYNIFCLILQFRLVSGCETPKTGPPCRLFGSFAPTGPTAWCHSRGWL